MTERRGRDSILAIDAAGATVLIVVTALAWLTVVNPSRAAVQSRLDQQSALVRRTDEAAQLHRSVTAMQEQLDRLERNVEDRPVHLRSVTEINQQLAALGDLATSSGLEIDDLEVGTPAGEGEYSVVPILFEARGGYGAAATFLHRLHESMPDGAVRSFELAGNPARSTAGATFTLRLAWFALPGPAR